MNRHECVSVCLCVCVCVPVCIAVCFSSFLINRQISHLRFSSLPLSLVVFCVSVSFLPLALPPSLSFLFLSYIIIFQPIHSLFLCFSNLSPSFLSNLSLTLSVNFFNLFFSTHLSISSHCHYYSVLFLCSAYIHSCLKCQWPFLALMAVIAFS